MNLLSFVVYISSEFNFLGKIKNPPPKGVSEGARVNGLGFSNLKNTYIGTTQSGEPSEGTAQSGEPTRYNFKHSTPIPIFLLLQFIPYYSKLFKKVKR
jgi:hypothetical protein